MVCLQLCNIRFQEIHSKPKSKMFTCADVQFKFMITNHHPFLCDCSCKIKFNHFVADNPFLKGRSVIDLLYIILITSLAFECLLMTCFSFGAVD